MTPVFGRRGAARATAGARRRTAEPPGPVTRDELIDAVARETGYRDAAAQAVDTVLGLTAPAPNARYVLAYEAAAASLTQQDATLGNLRNRVTWLMTISTLIATFSSTVGLAGATRYPVGVGVGLLAAVVIIAFATVGIHWPAGNWAFGPNARGMLDALGDEDRIRHAMALGMIDSYGDNARRLKLRMKVYELAAIVLALETLLVVSAALAYR